MSGLVLRIQMTNGRYLDVRTDVKRVYREIKDGKELFVEVVSRNGIHHLVNTYQIVSVEEVDYL